MPTVLITPEAMLHRPAPYVTMLREAGFDIRYPEDPHFTRGLGTEAQSIEQLRGAAAVIAGGEFFTEKVMQALPELRVISRSGVGYDRVDVEAATRRGIAVTITPTANHEAVAEFALALMFAVAKQIVVGDAHARAGRWPRTPMQPIRGKTFGIVGLGRIGRSTATRVKGLGMTVLACEKFPNEEFVRAQGIELVDLDALLARSDYVSLHCPHTPETRRLANREFFAKMKPGSVLLNTARGELVVEADLLESLQSGHLAGAGLDVFEQEPPSPDNPLFKLSNIVVAPHIAGADELSQLNMGIECARNIIQLARGEWPEGAVVNADLKGLFRW